MPAVGRQKGSENMRDKEIRDRLGHNGRECMVRIARDGSKVERYGSPEPTDRSSDYWQYLGTREQVVSWLSDN